MFRYMLLGLLRNAGPLHGYALMKEYQRRSGVQMSTGNFYRELQRLFTEGLVAPGKNPPSADPRRVPYEITPEGIRAFDAWFALLPALAGNYEDEISARAVFIADAEPEVTLRILDRWHDELWIKGKQLERAYEDSLLRKSSPGAKDFDPLPVLSARRRKHIAADMEFVEELRSVYKEWIEAGRSGAPAEAVATARTVRLAARKTRSRDVRSTAGDDPDDLD